MTAFEIFSEQMVVLILPLVLSGIFHMVAVKINFLPWLKIPMSEKLFGLNKTWRGVVLMPLLTIPSVWIAFLVDKNWYPGFILPWQQRGLWWWGIMLGLGYILAELPNSFIKRKRGIAAGQLPEKGALPFLILDQADSAIGCAVVYAFGSDIALTHLALLAIAGTVFHLFFNALLFYLGLRKNKF